MKYMLDTNVLMHVVNFNSGYRRIIKQIERTEKADMVLSAVTYFELTSKIIAAKIGREKAETLAELVGQFKVLPYNAKAAMESARLFVHLERSGKKIGERDTMIAGHAKSLGLICVTNNTHEFDRVPGLKVEDWLAL